MMEDSMKIEAFQYLEEILDRVDELTFTSTRTDTERAIDARIVRNGTAVAGGFRLSDDEVYYSRFDAFGIKLAELIHGFGRTLDEWEAR